MSLSRKLVLIISALLVLVFIGTLAMSISSMRSYIAEQLESHAQDTATSLGLSLQPYFADDDIATMDTMVNSIFDRGYYKEITIIKADGKILIERQNPTAVEGVPQWFVGLVPLDTPMRESIISAGWMPGAKIFVRSHPGYAYNQLWENTMGSVKLFAIAMLVAWLVVLVVLRFVLKPLKDIESQALAIAEREFPILDKLPSTREFRSVVIAMNKMSAKVKGIIEEQAGRAERMRLEAYVDPVTELGNRRTFDMQLDHLVSAKDEIANGALFMIKIDDFAEYNEKMGYAEGDKMLVEVAKMVAEKTTEMPNVTLSRIGGAEFAVLAQNITTEETRKLGELLGHGLGQFKFEGLEQGVGHIGIGYYTLDLSSGKLLAQADMALRHALQKGPNAWHMYEEEALSKSEMMGAREWEGVIQGVIEARRISFLYQPAKSSGEGGETLHLEALARIMGEDGSLIPAAVFMPMVERLNLTGKVDKMLVESLIAHMEKGGASDKLFSINLFSASVHDETFVRWLLATLRSNPRAAKRLIFELLEYGALADIDGTRELVDNLKKLGASCTMDNFGSSSKSFGYLRDLKLEFIKLDGSYVKNIDKDKDNQLFVEAITDISHGLDIKVIAKSVETSEELGALRDLKVDGAQGYLVGKPSEDITG